MWSLLTACDRLLLWKSWKVKSRLSTSTVPPVHGVECFSNQLEIVVNSHTKCLKSWHLLIDIKSYCIVIIYMYRCHWDILGLVDNSRGCRPDSLKGAAVAVPLLLCLSCC